MSENVLRRVMGDVHVILSGDVITIDLKTKPFNIQFALSMSLETGRDLMEALGQIFKDNGGTDTR